jgi:hypothetical protein
MKIERISPFVHFEEFNRQYFIPEKPVIVEDVVQNPLKWTIPSLKTELEDKKEVYVAKKLWYETSMDNFAEKLLPPPIVSQCMESNLSFKRKTNCRIWINNKNNFTPFHYDGNALFVFNLQVIGKKRWFIVSPDTPLPCYPFSRTPYLKFNDSAFFHKKYEVYDFELNAGEMLFLPPFWFHRVNALAEENININWVGTKRNMNETRSFLREKEVLKCAKILSKVPLINHFIYTSLSDGGKKYLDNYGGAPNIILNQIISDITVRQCLKRFFREIVKIPRGIKDLKLQPKFYKG